MGSSATVSSATGSLVDSSRIFSHKSHSLILIDLKVFVFEREQNYLQNDFKLSTIGNKLIAYNNSYNIEGVVMLQLPHVDMTYL